jgi:hypothetical protein
MSVMTQAQAGNIVSLPSLEVKQILILEFQKFISQLSFMVAIISLYGQ